MKRALTMAVLGALSCASPAVAQTQQNPARLSEYVEFGGNGLFTINGEARIADGVSLRLGGMFVPLPTDDQVPVSGVAMANKLVGREGRYIELGAGVAAFGQASATDRCRRCLLSGLTATIGYRRETHHRVLRVTFAPVFVRSGGLRLLPMVGVSFGRTS